MPGIGGFCHKNLFRGVIITEIIAAEKCPRVYMTDKFNPRILGDYLKKITAGDFVLLETVHPPGSVIPKHIHEYVNITITVSGAGTRKFNSRVQEYVSESVLTTPSGEPHTDRFSSAGARCLHIKINPKRTENSRALTNILECPAHLRGGYAMMVAGKIYNELKIMDDVSSVSIESLILELLVHMSRSLSKELSHAKPPAWLCTAREFIHTYFDRQIALNDVAHSVGINASHLARMFRKHYRLSVGEYIRRLRLDFAARQLSQSEQTIIEIANASGFYDQSHFSHAFKLHTGTTPAEFRSITKSGKPDTRNAQNYNIF